MNDTDEREALATVLASAYSASPYRDAHLRGADAILASDVWRNRRQGPPTDVHDAIVAEQKRIAALPDNQKPWTGEEGRAWQYGMANAARIARAALEADRSAS